ncbi:MAG: hypothetical protein U0996_26330 [Planctomycetaceae bacterium]
MRRRSARNRLTTRDKGILTHVGENRASSIEVLHAAFFPGKHLDAAKSTLRRLCNPPHCLLKLVPLDGRRSWYQLTQRGARLAGFDKEVCQSLGHQSRARRYALQWYFYIEPGQQRRPCQIRNFPSLFPIEGHRLPQGNFYVATASQPAASPHTDAGMEAPGRGPEAAGIQQYSRSAENARFGFAMIDCGAKPQRIGQRLLATLRRFLRHGWFDDFFRSGNFEITLLTITASRKRAYQHALPTLIEKSLATEFRRIARPDSAAEPIRIAIHVVPRLIDLIPGRGGDT